MEGISSAASKLTVLLIPGGKNKEGQRKGIREKKGSGEKRGQGKKGVRGGG